MRRSCASDRAATGNRRHRRDGDRRRHPTGLATDLDHRRRRGVDGDRNLLLAAIAIAHALAPTEHRRRAAPTGERTLRRRIAPVTTGEFGLIARAVNDLAERLAQTTAERAALTKRLFEVQEDERRALARDLHDEFGQCLTATLAFAARSRRARRGSPRSRRGRPRDRARRQRMMTTLRDALARLRSQDLDELGLEACLVQLVASWNARAERRAVVHLDSRATSPTCRDDRRASIASRRNA